MTANLLTAPVKTKEGNTHRFVWLMAEAYARDVQNTGQQALNLTKDYFPSANSVAPTETDVASPSHIGTGEAVIAGAIIGGITGATIGMLLKQKNLLINAGLKRLGEFDGAIAGLKPKLEQALKTTEEAWKKVSGIQNTFDKLDDRYRTLGRRLNYADSARENAINSNFSENKIRKIKNKISRTSHEIQEIEKQGKVLLEEKTAALRTYAEAGYKDHVLSRAIKDLEQQRSELANQTKKDKGTTATQRKKAIIGEALDLAKRREQKHRWDYNSDWTDYRNVDFRDLDL